MANDYFNHDTPLTAHTLARAGGANTLFSAVAAGFDKLPGEAPLNEDRVTYDTAGGSADAYTFPLGITAYTEGLRIRVKIPAGEGNTGASTINVNSLGAVAIKRPNGDDLEAGDLPGGGIIDLSYDGTEFRMGATVSIAVAAEADIADNAISTVKIQDSAVTTDKIANDSVTIDKLASNALKGLSSVVAGNNQIAYFTGAATTALAALTAFGRSLIGASDEASARAVLGVEIGTDVQAFDADIATAAASQGEMEAGTETALRSVSPQRVAQAIAALGSTKFLATADANNDAVIDFTAFDATKFDAYLFVLQNVIPATDGVHLSVRTSTDGGNDFDNAPGNYINISLSFDQADTSDTISTLGSVGDLLNLSGFQTIGSGAGEDGVSGMLMIFGPHLAKKTAISFEGSYIDSDGNYRMMIRHTIRDSSADVNAVRFFQSSGNIESGTITMYGLRNA